MSIGHYVYILQCADNTWYTGYTNDVEKRFIKHSQGKGAKYTRGRGPLTLIWQEACETKKEALQLEYALKRKSRAQKEQYVREKKEMEHEATNELS
ncbi:GIY-YIG nuclease family protein [Alkalicoccobacillus gibsonii]|uniref:GIY-YIG nuclease family protein n=1 Tax=Alkalicoccobacillus gibsonii TaxID=79881 RepID=UPI003512DAA9